MSRAAKLLLVTVVLAFGLAGCDSGSKKETAKKAPPPEKQKQVAPEPPPPPPPPDAMPEPKTPEEIEQARREAMLKGRDADVVKYCEMGGIEAGKSDEQALLGCTLAACRIKQADKAKAWSAKLSRPLMQQAIRICAASSVSLK